MGTWTQSVTGLNQQLATITFIGIRCNSGQTLVGETIDSATFDLKKEGSPTGTMTAQVYNTSNVLQAESDSVNITTLSTSYASVTFDNIGASAQTAGFFIVLALSGTFDSSNRVVLSMGATTPSNTTSRYTTNSTWNDASGITGEFATMSVTYGGVPPPPETSDVLLPPTPAMVRL
jgi:hypothetical protein